MGREIRKENEIRINTERQVNREYKDSIFRLLFSDEASLRKLYNDIKGTDYGEDVPVKIRTLHDALFIDIKNDIAFTIGDKFVVLIVEQSTVCENMPVRMLSYVGRIYEKIYRRSDFYKRKRLSLPVPEFFVFYNGHEDIPEESILRLSDSYEEEQPENSAELLVKVYNIKYNKGAEILSRNRKLHEYSLLVADVEKRIREGLQAAEAITESVRYCMDEGILYDFLREHGSEVRGMLFDYMSREEFIELRAEERAEELVELRLEEIEAKAEKLVEAKAETLAEAKLEKLAELRLKEIEAKAEEQLEARAEKLAEARAEKLAEEKAKARLAEKIAESERKKTLEIAGTMKAEGADITFIAKVTGLSEAEIKNFE